MIWSDPEKLWNSPKNIFNCKSKISCNPLKPWKDKKLSCKNYSTNKMKKYLKKFSNYTTFIDLKLMWLLLINSMMASKNTGIWSWTTKITMVSTRSKRCLETLKNTLIKSWTKFYTSLTNKIILKKVNKLYMKPSKLTLMYLIPNTPWLKDTKKSRELSPLRRNLKSTIRRLKKN